MSWSSIEMRLVPVVRFNQGVFTTYRLLDCQNGFVRETNCRDDLRAGLLTEMAGGVIRYSAIAIGVHRHIHMTDPVDEVMRYDGNKRGVDLVGL